MGNDWHRVGFSHYYLTGQKMNKIEATRFCHSRNSSLLEINSQEEEDFIQFKIYDLIGQQFLPSGFEHPFIGNISKLELS